MIEEAKEITILDEQIRILFDEVLKSNKSLYTFAKLGIKYPDAAKRVMQLIENIKTLEKYMSEIVDKEQ